MRGSDKSGRIIMKRRLRGITKWGGVTLCVLLFALWLASGWWAITMSPGPHPSPWFFVSAIYGHFAFAIYPELWNMDGFQWLGTWGSVPEWRWGEWMLDRTSFTFAFPLWFPFLLIALPTGYLFWTDHRRRMRAGCCEGCGYDLTGNKSGMCPECGMMTEVKKD